MVDNLVGSRYEMRGASEARAPDYHTIYPEDLAFLDNPQAGGGPTQPGYIHSVEIGSTVDGPGLRFVLFLTGCALRCQFCHNPDTWHLRNGRRVSVAEVIEEINRYADVLRVSRGGVTLSGGEPALQPAFAREIFRHCRKLGIHTCIDTSGFRNEVFSDADLADIDLHILDIKSGDPAVYQRVTSQPLAPTVAFAHRLGRLGRPLWVRFVLVPGLTDGEDNVAKVADICAELGSLERVEILRFHQMGRDKWTRLGLNYQLADTLPPTPELTERVRNQFRARGLTVY
ncbi:MAG: pyruvate formate lyase-activating protein [Wenzhouxiangella sp.]|nr:MAG: pyruvate formate lyase-activating protein [Wenzhouxiangella sp.]